MIVFSQYLKSLATHLYKLLKAHIRLLSLIDHVEHVRREQHRRAISLEAGKRLSIAQILPKVNVKHVSRKLDHDVVVVAIADAQYVRGDAVSRA